MVLTVSSSFSEYLPLLAFVRPLGSRVWAFVIVVVVVWIFFLQVFLLKKFWTQLLHDFLYHFF